MNHKHYYIGSDGELYHYGIKGMKWGVRRYQNPDGSLTPAGQKRQQKQLNKAQKKWDADVERNWVKSYNDAAYKINKKITAFNEEWDKKIDFKDTSSEGYRAYVKAYCDMWNGIYTNELESRFGRTPIDTGRKWCERVPMFMNPDDF